MPRWADATSIARGAQAIGSAFRGLSALAGGGGGGGGLVNLPGIIVNSGQVFASRTLQYGYDFTPTEPLSVVRLAAFVNSTITLRARLWSVSGGDLLADTTISAVAGEWSQSADIDVVELVAGQTYVVAIDPEGSDYLRAAGGEADYRSEIGVGTYRYGSSGVNGQPETSTTISGLADIVTLEPAGGAAGPVSHVASTTPVYTAGGTSLSQDVPVEAVAGDLLVASIMARSALTVPAGWSETITAFNTFGVDQIVTALTKPVEAGDLGATLTFEQAASARMGLSLSVIRGDAGTPSLEASGTAVSDGNNVDIAPFASKGDGRLKFAAGSAVVVGSGSWAVSGVGWSNLTPTSQADNRLAAFAAEVGGGATPVATLTPPASATDVSAVTLLFG